MLRELHVRQHVSAALYYNTYNPQHFFKRILLSVDKTQYHYGPVWDRVIHDSHNTLTLWVDVGGGANRTTPLRYHSRLGLDFFLRSPLVCFTRLLISLAITEKASNLKQDKEEQIQAP